MKARFLAAFVAVLAVSVSAGYAPGEEFADDFNDGDFDDWFIGRNGTWTVEDGHLKVTGPPPEIKHGSFNRAFILTRNFMTTGRVRVRAMPLAGPGVWKADDSSFNKTPCLGFMLRVPGVKADKSPVVLFEAERVRVCLFDSKYKKYTLGPCKLKTNAWNDFEVDFGQDAISVSLNGREVGSQPIKAGKAVRSGWLGLYTRCDARFDDFSVSGEFEKRYAAPSGGKGKPAVEFTEWRPEVMLDDEPVAIQGNLYVYLRNTGHGPAVLDQITLDETAMTSRHTPAWVAYVRQEPQAIPPGELGRIDIRFRGNSRRPGHGLDEGPEPGGLDTYDDPPQGRNRDPARSARLGHSRAGGADQLHRFRRRPENRLRLRTEQRLALPRPKARTPYNRRHGERNRPRRRSIRIARPGRRG